MPSEPLLAADPESTYQQRLNHWEAAVAGLDRRCNGLSLGRGVLFVVMLAIAWPALTRGRPSLWWALLPLAGFGLLALLHQRVVRRRDRARGVAFWYAQGLARLAGQWMGKGTAGERFRDRDHVYADDLDLFGSGSVFELLCTARTAAGEETLADWLRGPASPDDVLARQGAVAELRERLQLREDLAVLGREVGAGLQRGALTRWGEAAPRSVPAWAGPAAGLLGLLNVTTLVGATWFGVPPMAVLLSLGASLAIAARFRVVVGEIVRAAERPSRGLDQMAAMLERLERETFESPRLIELRASQDAGALPASRRIARLHRLIGLLDSRRNQLFAPVGALLLWTTQLALAVEAWRRRHGPSVGGWITWLGEFEALTSLATFAFEHPAYPFPDIAAGDAAFEATGLAHPLLPHDRAVANDVRLGRELRALVVSGSNMSGKSTLLRAVGVNAVLAQAGAPVRATRLRLSPLAIGASFRPQDSLQQGQSRFYAEIARIRAVMDLLAGRQPVLFLFDELLSGTNSHDRAIGARAIVEHLVAGGAIGLLTTHDLALAGIADGLAPRAANVHFEDAIEAGRLLFDYRLRPGVVERSNAIELMRSVGLRV
jgi:hypothetical protein